MYSVKVYLKTGFPRAFRILLFASSCLLLINALLLIEIPRLPRFAALASAVLGLLVLAAAIAFRLLFKRLPRVSALLLLLTGAALAWTVWHHLNSTAYPYATGMLGAAGSLVLLGLLEPLLNRPTYLYVSPKRLRLRHTPFYTRELSWANIRELTLGDHRLEIVLKQGRSICLKAAHSDNQHMRSHLNAIVLKARDRQDRQSVS